MTRINIGLAALLMLMGMVVTKAEECPITLTTCKEIPAACLTTLCPEIPYWRLKPPTTGILPKKVCVSVIQPSGAIEPSGGIRCNAALALTVLPITDVCPSQIYAYVEYTNGEKYAFRGAGHALLPTPSGGGFVPPEGVGSSACPAPLVVGLYHRLQPPVPNQAAKPPPKALYWVSAPPPVRQTVFLLLTPQPVHNGRSRLDLLHVILGSVLGVADPQLAITQPAPAHSAVLVVPRPLVPRMGMHTRMNTVREKPAPVVGRWWETGGFGALPLSA